MLPDSMAKIVYVEVGGYAHDGRGPSPIVAHPDDDRPAPAVGQAGHSFGEVGSRGLQQVAVVARGTLQLLEVECLRLQLARFPSREHLVDRPVRFTAELLATHSHE